MCDSRSLQATDVERKIDGERERGSERMSEREEKKIGCKQRPCTHKKVYECRESLPFASYFCFIIMFRLLAIFSIARCYQLIAISNMT